ncbi:hypothetical protein [Brachyspira aalborgi]|uniref:Uncharacterized protein n=1 Tax=Brachyspira aalborgi TaxID=29522 RepID=A0A5C8ECT3_9SPIR|nr:hypothetical protein [Brachyspira aalborgi]TXJ35278.1 hypothetical protein EPJ78_10145 [Brachyspira aalborgi]
MTEEQKKKCEKIINLYNEIEILEFEESIENSNDINFYKFLRSLPPQSLPARIIGMDMDKVDKIEPLYTLYKSMANSLSKIFDYEYYDKYDRKIKEIIKNISEARIPISEKFKTIGWEIANYFDKHFDNDNNNKENKNNE